ncbi:MAG: nucleoside triphosphate pyrophosphohydrolase [Pseudomonadota bacterium]
MTHPNSRGQAGQALARLMDLVRRLRAPDGCPWDRQQSAASVAAYLLEEAYEAVEAVEGGDPDQARGELGDLAFHLVFLAELYAQAGQFGLSQVFEDVESKMIRRHPHVFGRKTLADAEAVRRQWGQIKEQERGGQAGGLLESLPRAIPSLARSQRLGQRAARVGFDWRDAPAVWPKVEEELAELAAAPDDQAAQEELGDVLFSLAQWGRHRGINAEAALRGANQRFESRFKTMEALARDRGQDLAGLGPRELDDLWNQAKALEQGP